MVACYNTNELEKKPHVQNSFGTRDFHRNHAGILQDLVQFLQILETFLRSKRGLGEGITWIIQKALRVKENDTMTLH